MSWDESDYLNGISWDDSVTRMESAVESDYLNGISWDELLG